MLQKWLASIALASIVHGPLPVQHRVAIFSAATTCRSFSWYSSIITHLNKLLECPR